MSGKTKLHHTPPFRGFSLSDAATFQWRTGYSCGWKVGPEEQEKGVKFWGVLRIPLLFFIIATLNKVCNFGSSLLLQFYHLNNTPG